MPPQFSWTGFYVGANVGGVWGNSDLVDDGTGFFGSFLGSRGAVYGQRQSGVIGGFQGGYNWQTSFLVLGVESDFSWTSASISTDLLPTFPNHDLHNSRLSNFATVRGRAGIAFDRFLVFGTGGAAHASLTNEFVDTSTLRGSTGRDSGKWGWVAGGGIEYALTNNWTTKFEYLYTRFSEETVPTAPPVTGYNFSFRDSVAVARVGINYKF
jgi:outer membrane immunogenic protein